MNNRAGGGGGAIRNHPCATLSIANSTFSSNVTDWNGGAINSTGSVTIFNSTFSDNSSTFQVGDSLYSSGAMSLYNTIVANSTSGPSCVGSIINGGNNIDTGTTCGWGSSNGSMSSINPLLGPLQNNGGPTQTRALQPGSPAINAGNTSICLAAPVNNLDQRGVTRITASDPICDVGAYEATPSPTALLASLISTVQSTSQLSNGDKASLIAKLNAATAALGRKNQNASCGQLGAFVSEVNALLKSGRLASATGNQLITNVQQIITLIGCR